MLKPCLLTAALCGMVAMSGWPWSWWQRSKEFNLWKALADFEFQQGVEQFQRGKESRAEPAEARQFFLAATLHFEYCVSQNPSVCRNLGNSAFLADDLPRAVWSFHRAAQVAPNDRRVRESLEFVRSQVQYPEGDRGRPRASAWPPWLPRPTLELCRTVTLIAYAIVWFAATRWLMTRNRRWLIGVVATLSFCLAAGFGWWLWERAQRFEQERRLMVVTADEVPLFTGNGMSYPRHAVLPTLSRGMEARRLHQRGDWLQIQFATGEVGWVHRQRVLLDEP